MMKFAISTAFLASQNVAALSLNASTFSASWSSSNANYVTIAEAFLKKTALNRASHATKLVFKRSTRGGMPTVSMTGVAQGGQIFDLRPLLKSCAGVARTARTMEITIHGCRYGGTPTVVTTGPIVGPVVSPVVSANPIAAHLQALFQKGNTGYSWIEITKGGVAGNGAALSIDQYGNQIEGETIHFGTWNQATRNKMLEIASRKRTIKMRITPAGSYKWWSNVV